MRDGTAEGEKWGDYFGTIDSTLRYKPPPVPSIMLGGFFRLVFTNKHMETEKNGEVIKVEGLWEWKIDAPKMARWATPDRALAYVTRMRDRTEDPILKKNADKTIVALKRLSKACGKASAC